RPVRDRAARIAVSKDDAVLTLELGHRRFVAEIIAFPMRHGDAQDLPLLIAVGERRVGALDADVDMLADELQVAVAQQRARQQAGFAQNLEAVADSQNDTAVMGEILDGLHYRRESRDRARPQVVSVREPAWQNDRVITIYLLFFMPNEINRLA